ncbi:MAG: membrane protein insertase YidC [Nocardioides sp.]|nr:membrane protein insertase YidC [Nocardioides sp.]
MSVLDPLSHALAAVLAAAHHVFAFAGAGAGWLLAIVALVVLVRLALLPLTIRGVRTAHASAKARPHLQKLQKKYAGRTAPEDVQAFLAERRRINSEHRVPRLGTLTLLAQVPIWMALYHLVSEVARGTGMGAMTPALVASLGAATLLGAPLASSGYLSGSLSHMAVTAGLAGVAALVNYLSQRLWVLPNTVTTDLPDAVARAQHLMPVISAVGMLVAGAAVPLALLVYWACNGLWTAGQAAVIHRWFPTPGSPAAARRAARLAVTS